MIIRLVLGGGGKRLSNISLCVQTAVGAVLPVDVTLPTPLAGLPGPPHCIYSHLCLEYAVPDRPGFR